MSLLLSVVVGTQRDVQTTVVADVLTKSHLAVHLLAVHHLDGREVIYEHCGTLIEVSLIGSSPPVALVAGLVKLASLIVETVTHLMTDHHTDGTVVDGIVGCRIKEGNLKDTGRETELVGGRLLVGTDGL